MIYFNCCVIYAAVRLRFALLSINEAPSKSAGDLKRRANKQGGVARRASHRSFMVDQLNVPPAEKVICMTHLQALIHLFSNRGANLRGKTRRRTGGKHKVLLIQS